MIRCVDVLMCACMGVLRECNDRVQVHVCIGACVDVCMCACHLPSACTFAQML